MFSNKKILLAGDEMYFNFNNSKIYNNQLKSIKKIFVIKKILIFFEKKKFIKNHNLLILSKRKHSVISIIISFFLLKNKFDLLNKIYNFYATDKKILLDYNYYKNNYNYYKKNIFKQSFLLFILILSKRSFFSNLAKNYDILSVFCYYNMHSLALIYYFKSNNKKVIDIQHGINDRNHYAYKQKFLVNNQQFIPDAFCLWSSCFNNKNFNGFKKIKLSYPKKIDLLKKNNKKFVIGYTLDWKLDIKNLNKILKSQKKIKNLFWYFRPHPKWHNNAIKKIEDINLLKKFNNALISKQSETLLTWMSKINVHITHSSSTILECLHNNIKTYTYDRSTFKRYSSFDKNKKIEYVPLGKLYNKITFDFRIK